MAAYGGYGDSALNYLHSLAPDKCSVTVIFGPRADIAPMHQYVRSLRGT